MTENSKNNSISNLSGWSNRKNLFKGILLIIFTFVVFYLLFRKIDVKSVFEHLRTIPNYIWLSATALTLIFPVLSAIRWYLILKTIGYKISIKRCLLIIIGIWPISSISPSKAGDLLKSVSLRKEVKPFIIAGSVLTERLLDLIVLSFFALIGGLIFESFQIIIVSGSLILAIFGVFIISLTKINFPFSDKIKLKVLEILHSLKSLFKDPKTFSYILFLTIANWFASIFQTYLLFKGVGAEVPLGYVTGGLPIAIFVGLLPITFGGMGTRDSAMIFLFAGFCVSSKILVVSILYSFFGYWLLAIIGLPFIKKALKI